MTAPTAAFLGVGAMRSARQALQRARRTGSGLLIEWESPDWSTASTPDVIGVPRRRRRGGRSEVALAPGAHAQEVLDLIAEHRGPVAVVVRGGRDDQTDRVLVAVDEVVALVPRGEVDYATALTAELEPLARSLTVLEAGAAPWWQRSRAQEGQAMVLLLAAVAGLMAVAVALGLVASALGRSADVQGRADVAALAGAAALRDGQRQLYSADPAEQLTVAQVRQLAADAARRTAQANQLEIGRIDFEGAVDLPTRVRVEAWSAGPRPQDPRKRIRAVAEVAVGAGLPDAVPGAGEYQGPFAVRQGQRMRPDVALAFDRMQHAATRAGRSLVIVSAYRSNAEQAELFRRHPDPKWVAPPGKSLHRLGTELDLGPEGAYGWLAAHAKDFGFVQRYSWEAWHYGFTANAGSTSLGYHEASGAAGSGEGAQGAVPSFVPERFAPFIVKASQRWNVGAALLAAQEWQESKFNPRAVSPVGAAGIAQFMPGTAASYGLSLADRFDPAKAIDAQAHLMHDLLRQFGSVPLALAAYNAGPGNVSGCMCVPAIPETQGYVQSILAKLGGAGLSAAAGLEIRLVA